MRAEFEAMPRFPLAEDVKCEAVDVRGMPAEWITTSESREGWVIYYLHGGGYVLGSINTHRELISRLARAAGARALAIDYRLAPENPFPAAVADSTAGYRWLIAQGVDSSKVVIAGDSAGGGLTVATLLALRDAGDPLPAAGVCLSPWTDMECRWESVTVPAGEEGILVRESVLRMARAYVGEADPRTPLASPIHADLTRLPPLLIQVGTAGDLLDDANRLAERARADGVDVTLETWDEMIHVWHTFAAILPEGQQAIDRIGEFIREKSG
jgi:acetyl esterase/lipase